MKGFANDSKRPELRGSCIVVSGSLSSAPVFRAYRDSQLSHARPSLPARGGNFKFGMLRGMRFRNVGFFEAAERKTRRGWLWGTWFERSVYIRVCARVYRRERWGEMSLPLKLSWIGDVSRQVARRVLAVLVCAYPPYGRNEKEGSPCVYERASDHSLCVPALSMDARVLLPP